MHAERESLIPHSRPSLGVRESEAVMAVLASGQLVGGPAVPAFERALADHLGRPHVLATSSGTAALHLALLALGVGAGDEVLLPSYACAALCHAVDYTGARLVIIDAVPGGAGMDVAAAVARVTPRTKAAIVPHLFGTPTDPAPLRKAGVAVVEDCAQALGARLRGNLCGTLGDISVFSCYATKILSAGQGGALACHSPRHHRVAEDLRTYDERKPYRVRYNYRMGDVEAALARVQLERLDGFVARRNALADLYRQALDDVPVKIAPAAEGAMVYRFVVRVAARRVESVLRRMQERGVTARRPVYQPLHRLLRLPVAQYPHAESAWRETVSLPLYPSLTDTEALRVVDALRAALS